MLHLVFKLYLVQMITSSLPLTVPAYILTEVASETELVTIQNQTININCPSMGIPPPSILWLKNRVPLLDNPYKNMRVVNNNQVLEISNAQVQDAGKYLCTVTNVAGQEKREFNLQVHGEPTVNQFKNTCAQKLIFVVLSH